MVSLLCERSPSVEARVVPLDSLAAEVGGEEAERILDRLRNPTTAEITRSHELEREAAERLSRKSDRRKRSTESAEHGRRARRFIPSAGVEKVESPVLSSARPEVPAEPVAAREREPPRRVERRSSAERRRGDERRQAIAAGLAARVIRSIERRKSIERRSGVDRRESRGRVKAREDRLRRAAKRQGLVLRKSRQAYGYILVDASTVDTLRWGRLGKQVSDLSSLDQVEAALSDRRVR
jgi:hypothetical protein